MKDMQFGKLTVLELANEGKKRPGHRWLCQCQCGKQTKVYMSDLKKGTTKSCGCIRRAMKATHRMTGSSEYYSWAGMKSRCSDVNGQNWQQYGGRGIKFADSWERFENFYRDMGPKPSKLHTLERIDNNGDYGPDNCCWATRAEQSANRRMCRMVTIDGQTKHVAEWVRIKKISQSTVSQRMRTKGWSIEQALSVPPRPVSPIGTTKRGNHLCAAARRARGVK